jgi:anaerobic ribonucleoside-triphosphate reductase activating protein
MRSVDELADTILSTKGIEGVTFTGGEPFAQAGALAELGKPVRAAGLSVFVFTGYSLEEISGPDHRSLIEVTDVLVAGRYLQHHRASGLPWRGSSNQVVHFLTDRYGPGDMQAAAEIEFHLANDGSVAVTGFPVGWDFTLD